IGLAAAVLLRRRSAALRHRVLAVAIVCGALMPAARWIAPGWPSTLDSWAPSKPAITEADVVPAELVVASPAEEQLPRGASPLGVSALFGLWSAGVIIALATP